MLEGLGESRKERSTEVAESQSGRVNSTHTVDPHYLQIPICKISYQLKFLCDPKIHMPLVLVVTGGQARSREKSESQRACMPSGGGTRCLPSCSSAQTVQESCRSLGFTFLCFSLAFRSLKKAPKLSAEVLSGAPKLQKAATCPPEKTCRMSFVQV